MDVPRSLVFISPAQVAKAKATPVRFFLGELLRLAAMLALVLTVWDAVAPVGEWLRSPQQRLMFVVGWAAFMAAWNVWSGRQREPRGT